MKKLLAQMLASSKENPVKIREVRTLPHLKKRHRKTLKNKNRLN